jgi:chromosome partitioning protein
LSVGDVLYDDAEIEKAIRTTKIANLSILPASSKLQEMDARLAGNEDAQFYLSEELETVKSHYHYILIDSPPNPSSVRTGRLRVANTS